MFPQAHRWFAIDPDSSLDKEIFGLFHRWAAAYMALEGQMQDAQTFKKAFALHRTGRLAEAENLYQEVLRASPRHFEALYYLAMIAYQASRHGDALLRSEAALAVEPENGDALGLRGVVLLALGRCDEALADLERAIVLTPQRVELHLNRGLVLGELGRLPEAISGFSQALALNPKLADAHNNRGIMRARLGNHAEALEDFSQAIALRGDYAEAYSNRGGALHALKRYEEALADAEKAIQLLPNHAPAHNNRASALNELRRFDQALACAGRAIALNPAYAEAYANRGITLLTLSRYDEAIASCDRALALQPDLVEAHYCRSVALESAQRYDEAADGYARVLKRNPALPFVAGTALYVNMHCCRWDGFDEKTHTLLRDVSAGRNVSGPYPLLALPSSPAQQKLAAARFYQERMPAGDGHVWTMHKRAGRKLRIGYFSADYRSHATAYLMAGLMETHDRSQFDITAFSFVPASADSMRRRLEASFDRMIDVNAKSDREVAQLARDLEIDIAVDLMGFNSKNRMAIFAHRTAPLQVNYLGYPGTISTCMDYIVGDDRVITPQSEAHFAEKIVYLPHSYQVNDSKRPISDRVFTRRDLDLPETGFVFCCFNNNYKLTPDVFDVWMRLLRRVEGSVLWLLAGNGTATVNLRAEAEKRGVAPDRIIFAQRMDLPDHLARHRAADLVLDTFYYGAHTTASDALWAGVPVVTKAGESFASRVGASLLTAVGLPELIATTVEGYEALAYDLATQPARLAALKAQLAENRLTCPLFDTARFTRNIEAAYRQMWDRYEAGLAPDHIHVREGS